MARLPGLGINRRRMQETAPTSGSRPALTLARQFALAGGGVMLVSALVAGTWMARRIETSVVRNSASATALYMESFLSPISQELARSDVLSPGALRALDEVFENTPLGQRVVSYKIWKPGGLVVASSDPDLNGRTFPPTDNLRRAWQGEIRADFEDLADAEDVAEAALGVPLLEVYSPVREVWSGKVVAIAEFYEVGRDLAEDLAAARQNVWTAVLTIWAAIGALLYGIVLRGSRTIERQKATLSRQLGELKRLSERNTALRLRVQAAASRAATMNDTVLRRIGADLHDGPAQHLALAALRLDALRETGCPERRKDEAAAVGEAVDTAMREIRLIARGLLLPDIADRSLCDIADSVVEAHVGRTGTKVDYACDVAPDLGIPDAVRICVYRMLQEALTNAWRHAGGHGQTVRLATAGGCLTVSVADAGPGLPEDLAAGGGMGLAGLSDRVESLGGTLDLGRRDEGGTIVTMVLNLTGDAA